MTASSTWRLDNKLVQFCCSFFVVLYVICAVKNILCDHLQRVLGIWNIAFLVKADVIEGMFNLFIRKYEPSMKVKLGLFLNETIGQCFGFMKIVLIIIKTMLQSVWGRILQIFCLYVSNK